MDPLGNGNNGRHKSIKNTNDVEDVTEEMAKLWWEDSAAETTMIQKLASSQSVKDVEQVDGAWVGKAKYMASVSTNATMERIWAKELYEMSSQEREDINNEIHGVRSSRMVDETPTLISDGIRSLRDLIIERTKVGGESDQNFLPEATIDAYRRIVASREKLGVLPYIHSQQFLIKFLRARFFDIEQACQHYFLCLDLAHCLFGDIALKRPLILTDLTDREQRYLKKGQQYLLPTRDRVGRRILIYAGREDRSFTVPEKRRVGWYVASVCSEDETTQKLGVVQLCSPKIDPGNKPFGEQGMALRPTRYEKLGGLTEQEFQEKYHEGKPLRTSALHFTGPDTFLYHVGKALILAYIGKEERKIIRFHGGSQMECNYSLKAFGVPSDDLPSTEDGHGKKKKIMRFLAARESIEALQQKQYELEAAGDGALPLSRPAIECPEVNCVIFGDRAQRNAANIEFRTIMMTKEQMREEQIARCEDVPPVKDFINSIIQTAISPPHNLRFVQIDKKTSLFFEIEDPKELCSAVSQALRDQRKRVRLKRRLSREAGMFVVSKDSENGDGSSIIGFDATKRQKGSLKGCCNP